MSSDVKQFLSAPEVELHKLRHRMNVNQWELKDVEDRAFLFEGICSRVTFHLSPPSEPEQSMVDSAA